MWPSQTVTAGWLQCLTRRQDQYKICEPSPPLSESIQFTILATYPRIIWHSCSCLKPHCTPTSPSLPPRCEDLAPSWFLHSILTGGTSGSDGDAFWTSAPYIRGSHLHTLFRSERILRRGWLTVVCRHLSLYCNWIGFERHASSI